MQARSHSAIVCSRLVVFAIAAAAVTLPGCGGTAVLKQPQPLESSRPLAEVKDERIFVSIDTVILRNGPGAWARDAEWDEYLIRIRALSDEPVEITEIAIFDALDQRIAPRAERSALVDGTREIEHRYAQSGQLVRDRGGIGWVAAGVGVAGTATVAGIIAASAAPTTGFLAGAAQATAAAGAALTVVAGAGLVFAGAGIVRMVNNAEVNTEIKRRQTTLPVTASRGAGTNIDLFFPLTPLSSRAQVVYADRHGEHRLDIDTRQALIDLNPTPVIITRIDPEFPEHARRKGIVRGYVTAQLTLDRQGRVQNVEVIESVPRRVFSYDARRTFQSWIYNASHLERRVVEARLDFKR